MTVDPTRRPVAAMRLAPGSAETGEILVTAGFDSIVRVFVRPLPPLPPFEDACLPRLPPLIREYAFQDLRANRPIPHTIFSYTSNAAINSIAICPTNPLHLAVGHDNGLSDLLCSQSPTGKVDILHRSSRHSRLDRLEAAQQVCEQEAPGPRRRHHEPRLEGKPRRVRIGKCRGRLGCIRRA